MTSPGQEEGGGPVPSDGGPGSQDARRSLRIVLTLPIVVLIAAVLGSVLAPGPGAAGWSVWLLAGALAVVVVVPSAVGAFLGRRASRAGSTAGRAGFAINLTVGLVLVAVTVVGSLLQWRTR